MIAAGTGLGAINILAGIINRTKPTCPSRQAGPLALGWRFFARKVQSMKTNVLVRLSACVVLLAGVAACTRPGETPEQFHARVDSALAELNTISAQMQADVDRRNASVPRVSITNCSPNGVSYNCITSY
jgi:hypothetical protein